MLKLVLIILLATPLLTPALLGSRQAVGADQITPRDLELYPTWSAVGIELTYEGDENQNAQVSCSWQRLGERAWRNGVEMTFDRQRKRIWSSVWPLEQGESIVVRLTISDPDGGGTELTRNAIVKKMNLDWNGFRELYVSPTGDDAGLGTKQQPFKTLGHAARQAMPGTVVYAASGIYAEADLFQDLQGTETKPIVFAAAANQTPIIDSSHALPKGHAWQKDGQNLFMTEARFDGGYVAQSGLRSFNYPSLAELQADRLKVGRAWYYDQARQRLYVRTGTDASPGKYVYHLSQNLYGLHLTRSQYVIVRGFTIRHAGAAQVRISEGAQGCILLENKLHNGPSGVFMKSESTCDNALWRNEIFEPGMEDVSWTANYAYGYPDQAIYCDRAGRGNSFCFNRIYSNFDLIAVESWKNPDHLAFNRDCDILFNDLWHAGDDAIEVDGGGVNMRIHGNEIRACFTGISLAPIERGPVYVTRNTLSFYNLLFKFNVAGCTSLGWAYLYHNTGYCVVTGDDGGTGFSFPPKIPVANKVLKNNIVISNEWSVRAGREGFELDGNCYYHVPAKPPRRFQWDDRTYGSIAKFRAGTGQENHGLYADPLLRKIDDVGQSASEGLSEVAPRQYRQGAQLESHCELKEQSPCIDAAVLIDGINDLFSGRAPDIGAVERLEN